MASCDGPVLDRVDEDSTGEPEPGKTCGKCGAIENKFGKGNQLDHLAVVS